MPIYVYRCHACGHDFEELILNAKQSDGLVCPKCQSASLERRQAAFATTSGSPDSGPVCGQGACSACAFDN